eukprot:SAG31_NODE_663_length_13021_cov_9.408296_4_plen_80_part_00
MAVERTAVQPVDLEPGLAGSTLCVRRVCGGATCCLQALPLRPGSVALDPRSRDIVLNLDLHTAVSGSKFRSTVRTTIRP